MVKTMRATANEYKVYRVEVERLCDDVDMDGCTIQTWETIFKDIFPSKTEAIRHAQSKFAKQPLNMYVHCVYAAVYPYTISNNGMKCEETEYGFRKRVYNLYKIDKE